MSGPVTVVAADAGPTSPPGGEAKPAERRAWVRYRLDGAVWVRRAGGVDAAASMIDVSLGGAAVRVAAEELGGPAWVHHLATGDEVWLVGLLRAPITCWAVARDGEVLRLRFWHDAASKAQLTTLLAEIAAAAGTAKDQLPAGRARPRRFGFLLGAAALILAVGLGATWFAAHHRAGAVTGPPALAQVGAQVGAQIGVQIGSPVQPKHQ